MPTHHAIQQYLGDLEPVAAMRRNADRVRALVGSWTPEQFERTYAPGKWTARQILTHLAHTEMALGTRARMALSTPNYTAQPFDQDRWVARESRSSGTRCRRRVRGAGPIQCRAVRRAHRRGPRDRDVPSRVRDHHGGLDHSSAAGTPAASSGPARANRALSRRRHEFDGQRRSRESRRAC